MKQKLIAPCGMNCAICIGYLRAKNRCIGCREENETKPDSCRKCIIINCILRKKNNWKYCSKKCEKFPCKRLKNLNTRYKTKYGMSMLENLENIAKFGIRKFVQNEKTRWKCKKCGKTLCVYRDTCLTCGAEK